MPILSVDKRTIGDGQAGEVTKKLVQAYDKSLHGEDEKFAKWLSLTE